MLMEDTGLESAKRLKSVKPARVLVLGFLLVLILGTIALKLPISSVDGESISWVDAFFTSTSAVCVTGLVVVNTAAQWSIFGQCVILALIQIGGLGFMAFTTLIFMIMGRRITLKERLVIQEALNQSTLSGIVKLTRRILIGTFLVEGIGAFLLSFRFIPQYGAGKGIFFSIFHSVSAFCNAGFDIIGNNMESYTGDLLVNFVIMALIILGGLGFVVWMDLLEMFRNRWRERLSWRRCFSKLHLHSKLVLVISASLILLGFLFFLIVEWSNPETLGGLSGKDKVLGALFQSVSTRTAGFNSISQGGLNESSKFMTIILMFIGGSSGGTAGGIKTVTIAVLLITVISVVRGKRYTEVFGRRIGEETIRKSMAVFWISLTLVMGVTMILNLFESADFISLLFETTSAFGTVGLSVGITGSLRTGTKCVLAFTMFVGRLGPMTMAVAFTASLKNNDAHIKPAEENVMVG
ncbi:MAG: TrkH family potassium uptake protein [Clostridia bacterium]